MARDPKRISAILTELGRIWGNNPDWRLGQIIENAVHPPGHSERGELTSWLFYLEDDALLTQLRKVE